MFPEPASHRGARRLAQRPKAAAHEGGPLAAAAYDGVVSLAQGKALQDAGFSWGVSNTCISCHKSRQDITQYITASTKISRAARTDTHKGSLPRRTEAGRRRDARRFLAPHPLPLVRDPPNEVVSEPGGPAQRHAQRFAIDARRKLRAVDLRAKVPRVAKLERHDSPKRKAAMRGCATSLPKRREAVDGRERPSRSL
jgi:hypothetical protein